MNIQDIQIGDWFLTKEKEPYKIKDGDLNEDRRHFIETLSPMPLTYDILWENNWCLNRTLEQWWTYGDEDGTLSIPLEIIDKSYVHEIQHSLRKMNENTRRKDVHGNTKGWQGFHGRRPIKRQGAVATCNIH